MYAIRGLCHRRDISMGAHGFCIDLSPEFKATVAKSAITAENIDHLLKQNARGWLDAAGFDSIYDPDNAGHGRDKSQPPGPNARPLWGVEHLRVAWGEWGPEHISIPGNACGLDIERRGFGTVYPDGAQLQPHNVDSLEQKYLLLIVFAEIAESIAFLGGMGTELRELRKRTHAIEYNPNCPMPYLVRLVGESQAMLDHLPPGHIKTKDVIGTGDTLEQAAAVAISKKDGRTPEEQLAILKRLQGKL